MKTKFWGDPYYFLIAAICGGVASIGWIYGFIDGIRTNNFFTTILLFLASSWTVYYTIQFWIKYKKEKLKKNLLGHI